MTESGSAACSPGLTIYQNSPQERVQDRLGVRCSLKRRVFRLRWKMWSESALCILDCKGEFLPQLGSQDGEESKINGALAQNKIIERFA